MTRLFALLTDLETNGQFIAIIEVTSSTQFKITEKKRLNGQIFRKFQSNAMREVCAVLSGNRKTIQSFELNSDEEADTLI